LSLLEVKDVEAGYGHLTILHSVDLTVDAGEIVAVVGPNGAGKSTLLKSVFRLLPLTSGTIRFADENLASAEARELAALGMGYVPQEGNTFPDLSVDENLTVALTSISRGDGGKAREEVYKRFPALAERRRQHASTLSGGERQMLALAGAIVTSPRFLALDEPTTGLAPTIVEGLIQQILGFRDRGASVLWVIEENPLQVLHHVDRVYLMQGGVIEQQLTAQELLSDESLREVFFGAAVETSSGDQQATPA
jgi:branched-chain amino acid transport system ATP-binding protein